MSETETGERTMTATISLSDLHEMPWADIEGAYVKVNIEVNTNPVRISEQPETHTETREGELVGRAEGMGLYWSAKQGENVPDSIGPCIYLDTPEDTILEVHTDKPENEILEFELP